ncbi:thioredoxin [Deinococcus ficus]|uniref:thioredoxin n=1 Tax=Deinococcus ficus TaxID=317577 RepID=UPI0003B4A94E|nr:thioredoxin [Deinococcus ficus]
MELIPALNDADFDRHVSTGFTLVDFWAPWCPPCHFIAPLMQELVDEYRGRVNLAKVNVDESPLIAMRYRTMSLPTVILFKDGEPIRIAVGAQSKRNYKIMLDQALTEASLVEV